MAACVLIDKFTDFAEELKGSLWKFTTYFYEKRTGRPFVLSLPDGRETHYKTVWKELTKFFYLETNRLMINLPPGHGKSTMLVYFIAWCYTHYPDCQFLYISFTKTLAEKHTAEIKAVMSMFEYQNLFGVKIAQDSSAKGRFRTHSGGTVTAYGSAGSITGQDAGLPNLDRFSGGVLMDDMHKPDEVHSDTMREAVIDNYNQTIKPRPRADNVGLVYLGQRLHEADLGAFLESGEDGYDWRTIKLKAIDDAGNVLAPNIKSLHALRIEQDKNPYVFSSQYQQEPVPAGGGIFQTSWFPKLDITPKIVSTFITADTAETEKEYNDATVFSFWGLYKPVIHGREIDDLYALHWLDCWQIRVEPADLVNNFMDFWAECMQFHVKPSLVAVEKKSTGSTLISYIKRTPGIKVHEINRGRGSGSKTERFLRVQEYVSQNLVSLPTYRPHTTLCIEHMGKITANNTHRFDDIADTLADAVKIALIDKLIISTMNRKKESRDVSKRVMASYSKINQLRTQAYS